MIQQKPSKSGKTIAGLFCLLLLGAGGCNFQRDPYAVEHYYNPAERDTLLLNMVTYIYKKPKSADYQTRHDPRYRPYYARELPNFELDRYYISADSTHYYFLIRPARHPGGNQRGVGGLFRVAGGNRIYDFEEIYNTPVLPEADIRDRGRLLFGEMVEKDGNISRYVNDKSLVEWPDERLKYDRQKNEWRYDL
jgi:hypothetical protein